MYTMLIGNPGARKNTAINLSKGILRDAGYGTFSANKTRLEKFLLDLEGGEVESTKYAEKNIVMKNLFGDMGEDSTEGQTPREMFIVAPEFNTFMPRGDLDFLSDLGELWDWDDEKSFWKFRLKNSKQVHIFQPTISILSGNTHAGFQEMFPPQAMGQGFLSRIILIYAEPSGQKITFPAIPSETTKQQILQTFAQIKEKVRGPASILPSAKQALDTIYRSWPDLDDQRFKHYSTRRFTHLLKLVLVCSAARISKIIDIQDVLLASTILNYTENFMPKALGEFGKSKHAEAANKLMQALYGAKKPLTMNDLWKVVNNDLDKIQDLSMMIQNLQNAEKIQMIRGEGFLPKQKALDRKVLYVDYSLLREYTQ